MGTLSPPCHVCGHLIRVGLEMAQSETVYGCGGHYYVCRDCKHDYVLPDGHMIERPGQISTPEGL